ncbi:MAG TPA: L,D-transpeptidase family protein [Gammaproteobacteria bacterium]|nr:L,D-transpeptidase family protein [Gammaproteobacteria bacterium]
MFRAAFAFALVLAAAPAGAGELDLTKDQDVVGQVQVIKARYEDTFVALGRQYGLGYEELRSANPGVDPWLPGEGTEIVLPTQYVLPRAPHTGIVVNVAELRLYYFPADEPGKVITHPISIGALDWSTPIGVTTVTGRVKNPAWYPPDSIRAEHAANNDPLPKVVPPGPDNPLGKFALRLGLPGYLIHGTNKPSGVGMRVTHGCIRLFPEDIEAMYKTVPIGTQVRIVNQPYKLGWGADGSLYLEAHAPLSEDVDAGHWTMTDLTREFVAVTEDRYVEVSWDSAETVLHEATGVPVRISGPAVPRQETEPGQTPAETTTAALATVQ